MKKILISIMVSMAASLAIAQTAPASQAQPAAPSAKPYCNITLDAPQVTLLVRTGFTAAICLPQGVTIKHLVTKAENFGWQVIMPWANEPRLFIANHGKSIDVNVHVKLSDETQVELVLKTVR